MIDVQQEQRHDSAPQPSKMKDQKDSLDVSLNMMQTQENFMHEISTIKETERTNLKLRKRRKHKLSPINNSKDRPYMQIYSQPVVYNEEVKLKTTKNKKASPRKASLAFAKDTSITFAKETSLTDLSPRISKYSPRRQSQDLITQGHQSIYSSNDSASVFQAVQQRKKAEHDVNRLNSRVRLLIQEEGKALKLIVQTRERAESILKNKLEMQEFKQQLAVIREKQKLQKQEQVHRKSQMNDTQASISIISARSKVTEMLKKKKDDVKNLKEEIKEFLQQHQKAERRQMKLRKSRRNEIFNTEQRIRDQSDILLFKKIDLVRQQKENLIKDEMKKLKVKSKEAKQLVKEESQVIARLKVTQNLQRDTIAHIQQLFNNLEENDSTLHKDSSLQKVNLNQHSKFLESVTQLNKIAEEQVQV